MPQPKSSTVMPAFTISLIASAKALGDTVTLRADVSNLTDAGDGKKLRFLVVEEAVRYVGSNKLRFHHMVVRAMPGGPDGLSLTAKEGRHSASVNLADLRQELRQYLTDYAETSGRFTQPSRPLDLAHLKAIARVQDDKTKEILQAAVVDVDGAHSKRDGGR